MSLPTASALDLALICTGSAILPRVRETSPGMHAGTARHRYMQRVSEIGRDAALLEIADLDARAVCEAIDLAGLPLDPRNYVPEVALAWDVVTGRGRELGRGLDRDYRGRTENEIVGTADVVGFLPGAVFVADWKSEHDQDVPPVRDNLQLRFYALAAARSGRAERAVVEIIRPREGRAWRERAELDAFDLAETAVALRELVASIRAAAADVPRLVVGAHCRRCRCLRTCPAQMALVRELGYSTVAGVAAAPGQALVLTGDQAMTVENAGEVLGRVRAARKALDVIEESIDAIAWQEPLPMPGGKVYGPQRRTYTTYDPTLLWQLLADRYGADVALSAVEVKATKSRLSTAVKARAKLLDVPAAALEREIVAALDAAGGVRSTTKTELRVHRANGGSE